MLDKKNIKAAIKEMFESGEISVEIFKPVKEIKGDYDHISVQVKIDNEIVCEKGYVEIKQ